MSPSDITFSAIITLLGLAIAELWRKYQHALKEISNWQRQAMMASIHLQLAAEAEAARRGALPVAKVADVVADHQSPVTEADADTALLNTTRACIAAAVLALGQPADISDRVDALMTGPPRGLFHRMKGWVGR